MNIEDKIQKEKKDPVCGMMVAENTEFRYFYKDRHYYFCGEPCLISFAENPEKYIEKSTKQQ